MTDDKRKRFKCGDCGTPYTDRKEQLADWPRHMQLCRKLTTSSTLEVFMMEYKFIPNGGDIRFLASFGAGPCGILAFRNPAGIGMAHIPASVSMVGKLKFSIAMLKMPHDLIQATEIHFTSSQALDVYRDLWRDNSFSHKCVQPTFRDWSSMCIGPNTKVAKYKPKTDGSPHDMIDWALGDAYREASHIASDGDPIKKQQAVYSSALLML